VTGTHEEGSEPSGRAYERLVGDDELADVMLPQLRRRQDYFDYLEGHSVEAFDERHQQRTRRTLVKTYVLETRGDGVSHEQAVRMFGRAGHAVTPEGDALVLRAGGSDRRWALLEPVDRRYLALYTLVPSAVSDRAIRDLVQSTSGLDRLWLSAIFFDKLWESVVSSASPQQYAHMSFHYDALYEGLGADEESVEDEESLPRRAARMRFADTVATMNATLPKLRAVYQPLRSLVHLRAPSQGAGGHDIFLDGKLTNRSASFSEHRSLMRDVTRRYDAFTRRAEQILWPTATEGRPALAAPLFIEFSAPLAQSTFERWVTETFSARSAHLRLWGKPILLGPNKAQVYAIDEHLWQPIQLEMTRHHLLALLPHGTCGNSVNRLVTNLQRTLDPGLRAWLADREYSSMLEASVG
jgi:hypothetical protein